MTALTFATENRLITVSGGTGDSQSVAVNRAHYEKLCAQRAGLIEALQTVKALALPGANHIHNVIDNALAQAVL